jgi:hypothetical protein
MTMKTNAPGIRTSSALTAMIGMAALGLGYATDAGAACAPAVLQKTTSTTWRQSDLLSGARTLTPAAFLHISDRDEPIVGLWKFKMIAKNNKGIPDGAEIDFGYAAWHSDGTELMNSGSRPPMTGDFCQGVWERVDERTFKLNHFALAWDSTGTVFVGPANILEQVVVDESRRHFSGVFSLTQYSTDEKTVLAHVVGVITADRVTVD